jgi:hypothetical protein
MAGEIAQLLMKLLNPKQAQWEDASDDLMAQGASPNTYQNTRRSIYGQPEDIELPAEGQSGGLGRSLQGAAEGLRMLRDKGLVKR